MARLRSAWLAINASYWFYPALFALAALLLALATIWFDRNGAAEALSRIEWLTPARPQGARSLLALIAASMIGVAATVFSITIAAVAYASGTYGPRLLTNFMEDRGNQLSLATFIATFVYTLLVLRVVRGEDEQAMSVSDAAATSAPGFVPQLSILIAFGLTIVSVAVLVYLLNHIPSSIRINKVIEGIGQRLLDDLCTRFPHHGAFDPARPPVSGEPLRPAATGYVAITDFERLDGIARDRGATISLARRTGEFVHPATPLLHWDGADPLDEKLVDDLRACFAIGASRSPAQDLDYLIDELVEIALRALSPGINDPFTAITALDWLGAATAELASRRLDGGPEVDGSKFERVRPVPDDFDHYLARGFGAVLPTVATSEVAAARFVAIVADMLPAAASAGRRVAMSGTVEVMLRHAARTLAPESVRRLESLRDDHLDRH